MSVSEGDAPERGRLGGLRAGTPAQDPPGDDSHPAPFLWCDGSSPNPVESLEMATETLVAMVILNSSDSDVALLGNRIRSPREAMPAHFFSRSGKGLRIPVLLTPCCSAVANLWDYFITPLMNGDPDPSPKDLLLFCWVKVPWAASARAQCLRHEGTRASAFLWLIKKDFKNSKYIFKNEQ